MTPTMNPIRLLPLAAAIIIALLFGYCYQQQQGVNAILLLISVAMGITLFKGMFGFAGAYARAFEHRDMSGIFAQIVMLVLATLLFAPILASGFVYDHEVVGAVAPLGVALGIGAFLFGIGMQLGGSCASGSLFVAAGGNRRTLVVLVFFCIGAFVGSLHLSSWQALPHTDPISLADEYGWEVALPLQLSVLAGLYLLFSYWHKGSEKSLWWPQGFSWHAFIYGSWPLMLSAGLLAVLNWLTLLVAGHPWSITWAFSLWGAKTAALLGWDPTSSDFWARDFQLNALQQPVLHDQTSLMNLGIFVGATLAAGISKNFKLSGSISFKSVICAAIAGILMGYGARLAYGCNIGAFFSGISSTSLHGWLWIICAVPGCWLGLQINKRL
ncbi:MAG: putative membrane protein YedE/YeeE [Phenylobacterium sp.]|jgi:uncharacterized membrane protein YedE/YeeE